MKKIALVFCIVFLMTQVGFCGDYSYTIVSGRVKERDTVDIGEIADAKDNLYKAIANMNDQVKDYRGKIADILDQKADFEERISAIEVAKALIK